MFHCALGPVPVYDWSISISEQKFGLVQFDHSSSSWMLLGPWHTEVPASVPMIVGGTSLLLLLLFVAVLWFLRSVELPSVGRSKPTIPDIGPERPGFHEDNARCSKS